MLKWGSLKKIHSIGVPIIVLKGCVLTISLKGFSPVGREEQNRGGGLVPSELLHQGSTVKGRGDCGGGFHYLSIHPSFPHAFPNLHSSFSLVIFLFFSLCFSFSLSLLKLVFEIW